MWILMKCRGKGDPFPGLRKGPELAAERHDFGKQPQPDVAFCPAAFRTPQPCMGTCRPQVLAQTQLPICDGTVLNWP
mgnify:CR=1 FL=1